MNGLRYIPPQNNRGDWPHKVAKRAKQDASKLRALEAATDWGALADHADDTAAATGGVAVGELYRTGSVVKVRVA